MAATGIVLDTRGRVLVPTASHGTDTDLPGGTVEDTETPEQGLARGLREGLGLTVPVGRLLAVDSRPPGRHGPPDRSLIVHVHLVGPLPPQEAAALTGARWLRPEEACAVLPARVAPRLRAGLAALHTGSFAHLVDGVPQPGSPAGLDPARRAALEHAGTRRGEPPGQPAEGPDRGERGVHRRRRPDPAGAARVRPHRPLEPAGRRHRQRPRRDPARRRPAGGP
ncbi:NUDIX domain-containing protein [Streptomyces virginiae]|uniref:NUDIX domain-containing protein n=1 Tax=Streptomyces virginiae TaxID=1961 RepID=UPI003413C246